VDSGFLREALIYLAAAVIAAPLFNRLKLGSVLGYLVAGVVIGPFLLNLVGDAEHTMHFAEFGVVILLFLIGLRSGRPSSGACGPPSSASAAGRCCSAARCSPFAPSCSGWTGGRRSRSA
jgi:hypothetical protein